MTHELGVGGTSRSTTYRRVWLAALATGALCCTSLGGCTRRSVADGEPRGMLEAVLGKSADQPVLDGVDLLFVIDDSISMADKQKVLADSLEPLRVIAASCSVPDGSIRNVPSSDGTCPEDWNLSPLLPPVRSAAVITTSMEAGGACSGALRPAHPLGSTGGYLPALTGHTAYETQLREVGDSGCGFEAPLEAMYRFLVDPEPPLSIEKRDGPDGPEVVVDGVDEELLALRRQFLSPYSSLVVVILTDEDDCSVSEAKDAWKVGEPSPRARSSSGCEVDPQSPCCRSCDSDETAPPDGCSALADDPVCAEQPSYEWAEDPLNLRCFDQKRRFGESHLFPIERYVRGLRDPWVETRAGELAPNPLFAEGRTPDMVGVLVLAGVPWQELAQSSSSDEVLRFHASVDYEKAGLWGRLLGDESSGAPPGDPHMIASIEPRPGLALDASAWDPIHGHEVVRQDTLDVQYSCIFDLPQPRECSAESDCICPEEDAENPLCRDDDGEYGTVQRRAQAYPPVRLAEFARALGPQAMLGSICPRTLSESDRTLNFGYAAAFAQLGEVAYRNRFVGLDCFAPGLPLDDQQLPACRLIEAYPTGLSCESIGRRPATGAYAETALERLGQWGIANDPTLCEVMPFPGSPDQPDSEYASCQNELHPDLEGPGYCYVDKHLEMGNPELTSGCKAAFARRIRAIPSIYAHQAAARIVVCDYGD